MNIKKNLSTAFRIGIYCLATTYLPCFAQETQKIGDPVGTNFPKDAEGRVYHLGLKKGEVANRILVVGDPERAKLIVQLLDHPEDVFSYVSNRGFATYTGTKNGIPVTIMSIGMGLPMMDFAVREIRAITEGPLSIIRLGSCGTPRDDISIGTLVVAKESFCMTVDYDAYHQKDRPSSSVAYVHLTKPLQPDTFLHATLVSELAKQLDGTFPVVEALDATADFFYGTQGRIDSLFDDRNEELISSILEIYPDTGSLQMETYQLFHLARLGSYAEKEENVIRTAACAIVLAQRKTGAFLSNNLKHDLEIRAGKACLDALTL